MITIEISEPGLQDARIDLTERVDPLTNRVTVGRRNDLSTHHISLRNANSLISRIHCTLEIRDGGESLWVTDGSGVKPSGNGTYLSQANGWKKLITGQWEPFRVGDSVAFCSPSSVKTNQFKIYYPFDTQGSTNSGEQTSSLGLTQICQAASRESNDGVICLIPLETGGLSLEYSDSTAEKALGYQSEELRATEGNLLFESIIPNAIGQAKVALQQDPAVAGQYQIKGKTIDLTMARRLHEGRYFLMAWIREVEQPKLPESAISAGEWAWIGQLGALLLNKNPWLFALLMALGLVAVVAIALL